MCDGNLWPKLVGKKLTLESEDFLTVFFNVMWTSGPRLLLRQRRVGVPDLHSNHRAHSYHDIMCKDISATRKEQRLSFCDSLPVVTNIRALDCK